jgi:hypothetical protein
MSAELFKELAQHATGTYAPALANVHVYTTPQGNRAQVSNGRYWVDSPVDAPAMTVNIDRLVAALQACESGAALVVESGHLRVRGGRARARIPLPEVEFPLGPPDPPGDTPLPWVVEVLAALEPFAATDASRPWAMSVCLKGGYAYATNNVVVARYPLPTPVTGCLNIPTTVVAAIRQRGPIRTVGYGERSVTFYYEDGSWVRTLLIEGDWPTGVVDGMLDGLPGAWITPHKDLGRMLATAAKMADDRLPTVRFDGHGLQLTDESFAVEDLGPVPETGNVAARMAALVFNLADRVQWHTPSPNLHAFAVGDLVGVLAGVRD